MDGSFDMSLRGDFLRMRAQTEALAAPLSEAQAQIQSMPDASPAKWHLAHTTWFWETFVLKVYAADYVTPDETYNYLFNSYYEAVGDRHPRAKRGEIDRPTLAEVLNWRAIVTDAVGAVMADGHVPDDLIRLGIAHEEQHQELLLTDIKHALWMHPSGKALYDQSYEPSDAGMASWHDIAGGLIKIGRADGARGFAFDNEGPRHKVWLEPYAMAGGLVTNADVKAFITDGGYQTPSLWLSMGWGRVQSEGWRAPLYWTDDGGDWRRFSLGGLAAIDDAAPASHLSYFEADAIAEWMGARLPTEAEWEHAALSGKLDVTETSVWQWTRSAYAPYPRYKAADGAIGEYNGKFMCGQYVLRGGSSATSHGHSRPTYRNFFEPHARWQFSGLRLARDP